MTLKIYTKLGDQGFTKQVTGKMVPKYDYQIVALGELDELESYLGVTAANLSKECQPLKTELQNRQQELYLLEGDIVVKRRQEITAATVAKLEEQIDQTSALIPPLAAFILPGGSVTAANLQYARTIARRAERALVELDAKSQHLAPACLQYSNRLSDYLFVLARYANVLDGVADIKSKK